MPVISPTGQVQYQGGEKLPTVGSQEYLNAQKGILPTTTIPSASATPNTPPSNPVMTPDNLSTVNPVTVPAPAPTTSSSSPTLSAPQGTTTDANGNAVVAPETKTARQQLADAIKQQNDVLATKGTVQGQLETDNQLQSKRDSARASFNAYNKAKNDLENEIEAIRNQGGGTVEGINQRIADVRARGNANLSNMALRAQVDQGLYSDAQQTIKDKLDQQFGPIKDNIDAMYKYAEFNDNDPEVKAAAKKLETDTANVQNTSSDVHKTLLENDAPLSALSEVDQATSDFANGKITATEAQGRIYKAAAPYGSNKLDTEYKRLQTEKLKADIAKTKAEAVQASNSLPAPVQVRVQGVAGQFDNEPAVRNYQTIAETLDAVQNAGNSPTDDIQRIYAVAKIMDPNSAVREGEYKTVQDYATSLLQRGGLKLKRVFDNSGFLTVEARNFINLTLKNRLASSEKAYKNIYDEYGRRINKITGKDDGSQYITDYSRAFSQPKVNKNDPLDIGLNGGDGTYLNKDPLNLGI